MHAIYISAGSRESGKWRSRETLKSFDRALSWLRVPQDWQNASRIPSRVFKEVLGTSSLPEVLPALLVSTMDKQQAPSCFSGQGNLIWQSLLFPFLPFKLLSTPNTRQGPGHILPQRPAPRFYFGASKGPQRCSCHINSTFRHAWSSSGFPMFVNGIVIHPTA